MDWIVRIFTEFNEGKVLLHAFQSAFRVKCILRHVIKARKSGTQCFSWRSLLIGSAIPSYYVCSYVTVYTVIFEDLIFCRMQV